MNAIDRREEFSNVVWQQGRLLMTGNTKYLCDEKKAIMHYDEQCCVFAFFTSVDEGRSRVFLYRHLDPETARLDVIVHNSKLFMKVKNKYKEERKFS